MSLSSDFTNQSIAPSSELDAAYDEIKSYFSFKGMDFFETTTGITSDRQTRNSGKIKFISTILSRDGAFYTEDLFGTRNLANAYGLKPINYENGVEKGDVSCYGAKLRSERRENQPSNLYNDLFRFIGLRDQVQQRDVSGPATPNTNAIVTTAPTDVPIESDAGRATTSSISQDETNTAINELVCKVINKDSTSPDAIENPHVSVYRYANPHMSISTAASDYCNVFFNSIDSINMSMCVPYVKINFIDRMSKKSGRYPTMSLVAFLKQSTSPDINDKIFYNARPILRDSNDAISRKILEGSIIGMESFLSPGTLLPDPAEVLKNSRNLDPSVPLMSLEGLTIGFKSGNTAAFSTRIANLNITLHDRSRMKDISDMLRPANWSMTYCEIEWGWIHPHASPQFNNPIARYLNALRVRNLFSTTTFNIAITSGNTANISISLTDVGARDSINASIYDGNNVRKSYAIDLFDNYVKSKITSDDSKIRNAITRIMPVTHMQLANERHGVQISREFLTKIIAASNKSQGLTDAEDQKLLDELEGIINNSSNLSNTDLARLKEAILRKVNIKGFGKETFDLMTSRYAGLSESDYVSVGSYLTTYVAMPLASLGLYDEVQIHTFCLNKGAGMIGGRPISDACIKIADVVKQIESGANDSVAAALSALTSLLSNPNLPTYGNASLSTRVVKGSDTVADPTSVDAQEYERALRDAATTGADTTIKTMPDIRHLIIAQPAKIFDEKSDNMPKQALVQPDKKILQIIVYDNNDAVNMSQIIKAYDYVTKVKSGDFQNSTLNIDQAREIAKIAYPSIVYGMTNSVIESINVSTTINEALQTQGVIDMGTSTITENSKSETLSDITDITVLPGTITLAMIGMPYIEVGQHIYVDMGTGTSLDNVYVVTSVGHSFSGMKFTTSITLNQIGQGILTNVNNAIKSYRDLLARSSNSIVSTAADRTGKTSSATSADILAGKT